MTVNSDKIKDLMLRMKRLNIRATDLVEKFVRGSGPGGQKINKTSIAVYLKHLPTGIEVKVQHGRSQVENRFIARRKLVEKLEATEDAEVSKEKQRIAKLQRQKRKRSKRAKEKLLSDKRHQSKKKQERQHLRRHDDAS
ncbi:MAG: peptide chain release factor-like protein [Myxococcales bacterium]|nr:peptide chain release factor-like protein [Myxococcales bacterium]